jgi:Secretion system C-terminal sorting domain
MKKSLLIIFTALLFNIVYAQQNIVSYLGSANRECLYDVTQLSNGTFLVCGYAQDLSWLPMGTPTNVLPSAGISNGLDTMNAYGFIMQLSNDLQTVLGVVHFPQGDVVDIRFMKFTSLPYATTGDLYISGTTDDTKANEGGFFIAKLNNNFVNGLPTGISWVRKNWAEGNVKITQPWDVGSDGRVIYVYGQSHAADWAQVACYNADGTNGMIPNWRTHWDAVGAEYKGLPAGYTGANTLVRSGIVLKKTGRCDLRSWTLADYNLWQPDGNGNMRKGKWPLDVLYNAPCNIASVSTSGPGYTGYKASSTQTYEGQSVVIDRRNNNMYIGMNTKSVLPITNSPDFEPAVIAMDNTGLLLWYSRLYHEVMPNATHDTVNSTPDQFIDGLAIDYTNNNLVVDARCHGNNVSNFWNGNQVATNPGASAFQNQFTGTKGDIHISWLGKLALVSGQLQASTYVAEYNNNQNANATTLTDPNLYNWPNPNAGWANLNTTRIAKNSIKVSANGSVLIGAVGRHAMTTTNAYQKNVRPNATNTTNSSWANFVRLYEPDFSKPVYSSLMTANFDTITGAGGDNTTIYGYHKTPQGIIGVGKHSASAGTSMASGFNIPTTNILPYGTATPSNESAILFYYKSTNMINLDDSMINNVSTPLAVQLQLNGTTDASKNKLQWQNNAEKNTNYYVVQRSLDGQNFTTISNKIFIDNPTNIGINNYNDNNPSDGVNYYKVIATQINGEEINTNIIKLYFDNPIGLNIYPNPSKNELYINLTQDNITYKIVDMQGKIIRNGFVANQYINLEKIPAGTYMLVISANGKIYNRSVVVQ